MPKIQFLGRVLPDNQFKVSLPSRNIQWGQREIGAETTIRIRIAHSLVSVECESNAYSKEYLGPLYVNVYQLVRAAVNVACFARGQAFSIIIDWVIGEDGSPSPIMPQSPEFSELCTVFEAQGECDEVARLDLVYDLALHDRRVANILNDVTSAIRFPHAAPAGCQRAIDGIKSCIAGSKQRDPKAWETMRAALNISAEYLEVISKISAGPRHAAPVTIPGPIVADITRRAWIVVDRYLHYRLGNRQPLSEPEFPLLT